MLPQFTNTPVLKQAVFVSEDGTEIPLFSTFKQLDVFLGAIARTKESNPSAIKLGRLNTTWLNTNSKPNPSVSKTFDSAVFADNIIFTYTEAFNVAHEWGFLHLKNASFRMPDGKTFPVSLNYIRAQNKWNLLWIEK